ncbi:unnamed protein product [Cuscuta campestris]|uniref:Uncharacterized protein n=1 Tax=Cuscuta campestris TaxID=132261 RepID=A0A484LKV6_9ASTE|nr:unnamed protein product [Cuscuta campestris]
MARFVALFALCALAAAATTISGVSASRRPIPAVITLIGRAYVDTCNVGFETTHSLYPAGSTVKLVCKFSKTSKITYTDKAVTGANGEYKFTLNGRRSDKEVCHVQAIESVHPDAGKPDPARESALVILNGSNGIASNTRYANNVGFATTKPLSNCAQIVSQYHLNDDNF